MQSSKIFAKTMAPKIIQDVVLIHPPKAVAAGAIPLIKYKDGSRIAGMIVSKKSKPQTKIINTVINLYQLKINYNSYLLKDEKNVLFDWNNALNFNGDSSLYAQYNYARIQSILQKFQSWAHLRLADNG